MSETSRLWIEAASSLAKDPTLKLLCPTCKKEYLAVKDEVYDKDPSRFERHLTCSKCGSTNSILLQTHK